MRDYSASIWAKQEEAIASTSDCCLRPCLLVGFLYVPGGESSASCNCGWL